jgi:hypothetical protein
VDTPHDRKEIIQAVKKQITHGKYSRSTLYGDGTACVKSYQKIKNAPKIVQKHLTF